MDNPKQRLDLALVERGLAESRERARAQIMAGEVRVNDQVARRPAVAVRSADRLAIDQPPPYVSRGGFKLAHAFEAFGLDVRGLTVVDVGASTGGFTDVLLQRGCRRVYAVDVGHGQLVWRLQEDPRVVVLDRTNVRFLESLPEPVDAGVVDVSFISLSLVLPVVLRLLNTSGWIVALVKPQFEAGRAQVGKGGVVRDPAVHRAVLEMVLGVATGYGLNIGGCASSPILGPSGNREFLVWLRRTGDGMSIAAAIGLVLDSPAA